MGKKVYEALDFAVSLVLHVESSNWLVSPREQFCRKINENKLLSKKNRWTPYGKATTKCMICKQQVHQDGKYCHTCAYSKGLCAMCGKQVLNTKMYKQSNVNTKLLSSSVNI